MISVQENSAWSFNLDDFKKNPLLNNWTCQKLITKTGMTSWKDASKTIISICNKQDLKSFSPLEVQQSTVKTKFIGGYCYKNDDTNFCFMGGHLPVKIDEGAKLINDLILEGRFGDEPYFIYLAGDINTRANFESKSDNVKKCMEYDQNLYKKPSETLAGTNTDTIIKLKSSADELTQKKFSDEFKNLQTGTKLKSPLKFIGNTQLHKLPFTYKYRGKDETSFNEDKVFEAKTFHSKEETQVFNIGWLDRMLCVTNQDQENCLIQDDKNFKYFLVPRLKKGDHMPVLGYFTIKPQDKKKNQNQKKKKI